MRPMPGPTERHSPSVLPLLAVLVLMAGGCSGTATLSAGTVSGDTPRGARLARPVPLFGSGLAMRVPVVSYKDYTFQRVEPQAYDFSCGAAAVATLLTYHYGQPTTEQEVFTAMWRNGDRAKIVSQGFSMLDMKNYLTSRGLKAGGFQVPLDAIIKEGVPVITLIDMDGYKHFVVIKGIDGDRVLLGDPRRGNITVPRDEFEASWNGIVLVVAEQFGQARRTFNTVEEWRFTRQPGIAGAGMLQRNGEAASLLKLPATPIQLPPTL